MSDTPDPNFGQQMPTPNEKPALWPMVMKGYKNSTETLDRYVNGLFEQKSGDVRAALRELYLNNMLLIAIIAKVMGKTHEQVLEDMNRRHEHGAKKYGTALQPFNGRNATQDAYEEMLDGQVYLRQALFEDGLNEED